MRHVIAALVGAFILTSTVFSEAAVVEFSPSPKVVQKGDVFSIDLVGTGFTSGLDGGGVNISFDSTIVSVLGVTLSPSWEFSVPAPTIGAGTVDGLFFASFVPKPSDFAIATLQLKALNLGTSSLVLSENSLNPFASGGSLVAVSFADGSVQVVPEPATSALLLAGLLLALCVRGIVPFRDLSRS